MRVIKALTADLTVQGHDALNSLAAALREALAPGERLLRAFEFRGGLAAMARVGHVLTARGGEERGQGPVVDADPRPYRGQRLRLGLLSSQDDTPPAALACDADRLHLPGHSVASQRQPSPSLASHRAEPTHPTKQGQPGFSLALTRRKNAANALTRRRKRRLLGRERPALPPAGRKSGSP